MDVFEAIESRIACRWFLEKPVDLNVVRNLIEGAACAASNGSMAGVRGHKFPSEMSGRGRLLFPVRDRPSRHVGRPAPSGHPEPSRIPHNPNWLEQRRPYSSIGRATRDNI